MAIYKLDNFDDLETLSYKDKKAKVFVDPTEEELLPIKAAFKIFKCRVCAAQYNEGVRYRSLTHFDYDICETCFNKEHELKDHP